MAFIAMVFFADLLARVAEVFIVYALPLILLVAVVYFLFAGSGSPARRLSGDEQKLVNKAIAHSASAKASRPKPKA
jgi:hypothetical protein